MSKRNAVIVRAIIFVCVFAMAFMITGRLTGVFESGSSRNFEAFGEEETSTTAEAEETTVPKKTEKKKTGETTTAKASAAKKKTAKKKTEETTTAKKKTAKKKTEETTTAKKKTEVTTAAQVETTARKTSDKKKTKQPSTTLPSDNEIIIRTDENGETYKEIVPESYGKEWYSRVVVRREIRVSEDYEPDIVPILEGCGYGCSLNRVAAKPYEDMYYAALKDGYCLVPYSAYRSYETQYNNFVNRIARWQSEGYGRKQAIENTVEVIMAPGGSEHNLGLAVDIINTDYDFDLTAEYAWLKKNAWKYGFIERYPRESRDITGVVREPWHWRYVGVKTAKEMRGTGLTLEQYLTEKKIAY